MRALVAAALLSAATGVWHDARAHLALRHPSALHVTTQQLTGITDPIERVALYSGRQPNAMVQPRKDQVIAILMEQVPPPAVDVVLFPPRPHRFRIRRLTRLEGFSGPRWGEITFRDHGRAFYLFAGVGLHADARIPSVLHAFDSLRVGTP